MCDLLGNTFTIHIRQCSVNSVVLIFRPKIDRPWARSRFVLPMVRIYIYNVPLLCHINPEVESMRRMTIIVSFEVCFSPLNHKTPPFPRMRGHRVNVGLRSERQRVVVWFWAVMDPQLEFTCEQSKHVNL